MIRRLRLRFRSFSDRAITITTASFCINAVLGVGKLVLGLHLLSTWFLLNAGYYLLLCAARGKALWQYRRNKTIEDPRLRYRRACAVFHHNGGFLTALGAAYFLVCLRMYFDGEAQVYGGIMAYLTAAAALVKLGVALSGNLAMRRIKNPIVAAIKQISFADALVSIVVTQCSLLTVLGSENATRSSAVFGAAVSAVLVGGGLWMLLRPDAVPDFTARTGGNGSAWC